MVGTLRFAHLQFAAISLVGQITKILSSPSCKNIPLPSSGKSAP